MKRFSLDIESLSLEPDALVLSVGAVLFDGQSGQLGPEYYAALDGFDQQDLYGRHISFSTSSWWMNQAAIDPATSDAFENRMSVKAALDGLNDFVQAQLTDAAEPVEFWFQGPQFDAVALGGLYRAAGIVVPWRYNWVRDLRTLLALGRNHGVTEEVIAAGIDPHAYHPHHALDDAKMQAIRCINTLRALGLE